MLSRLKEWLFPGKAEDRVSQVLLPGFQLASQNHLDFRFELRAKADADCEMLDWSDRTGIDPDLDDRPQSCRPFCRLPEPRDVRECFDFRSPAMPISRPRRS